MFWLYRGAERMCLFRHKWVVARLSKDEFQVTEVCSWCGKRRVRGLFPRDEQKHREVLAYEKGRQHRIRLVNEMRYEMQKTNAESRNRAREVRKQLQLDRQALLERIRAEKSKRHEPNAGRIAELRSELRGLLFGRQ